MCECSEIGNTSHFFLHCNLYGQLRHDLLDRVSTYCQPTVNVFLYGNTDLTDVENAELFSAVQHYMGLDARKPVLGVLRIKQAQTSLRIRAV